MLDTSAPRSWSSQRWRVSTKKEHSQAESTEIDRVLEKVLSKYCKSLAEYKIVQIIRSYTMNDTSSATRCKIRDLQQKLDEDEYRGFTRMILQKTLNSKMKHLEKQQGTPNGTPESSDDEDSEDTVDLRESAIAETLIIGHVLKLN